MAERFPQGRLSKFKDGSGTTQYCYDRFGHLVRKVQTTNGKAFTLRKRPMRMRMDSLAPAPSHASPNNCRARREQAMRER